MKGFVKVSRTRYENRRGDIIYDAPKGGYHISCANGIAGYAETLEQAYEVANAFGDMLIKKGRIA